MAAEKHLICRADALQDGGDGVRFTAPGTGYLAGPAFVVRYGGRVYAYLNRCAHVPVELDWMEGKFFDLTQHLLMCAVHGAHYDPRNGRCVMGPCKGASLHALKVVEEDGLVYLLSDVGPVST
ncbi:MAG: (2Fe-2S)-binding protein [Betaproteobacteria bacterium HGW-Betaproteobacteria-13]|jgi:nitrite reductase/ring-hydroxylating ferredoxin subunit|uniref:(2Fe-2S)-binding protein n=1 Tax=Parazoarcus communis TaxID=41977 RepID=A0A2U8H4L9_9RHOO|nr:Rieske 2Fe-2S domain-containing protein [Parazoarcus communis]AWI80882.1 (2Fe-2S)-binding protein [Parazoarcus communis]PKO54999.1 MAG: (2Fe-2S)-binding protein [Betaproteobacteria bacterium HGW-Betaproteobacteria-21]PKO80581.1 MAG: (2Fe-2S)-binding protein [Betaproteobacteria bacterium HGW-Betaproteobacteria-13]